MGVWVMQRGSKWEKEQQHKSERGGKERYGADYDGGGGMRECGGEKLEESKMKRDTCGREKWGKQLGVEKAVGGCETEKNNKRKRFRGW